MALQGDNWEHRVVAPNHTGAGVVKEGFLEETALKNGDCERQVRQKRKRRNRMRQGH